MIEKKCPQCRIPEINLECDGFCTWYCAFWNYHQKDKKDQIGGFRKWMSLNVKMLEERDNNKLTNRQKLSLKMYKKMKGEIKSNYIFEIKTTSKSNKDVIYITRMYETFDYCDCPGFKHRGTCKHIEQAKKDYKLFNF